MDPIKAPGKSQVHVNKIIIHCSATEDTGTMSWSAIRRWHTQVNGWDDIGYHAGIELVGNDYEVMIGRPANRSGAHTKGQNDGSLGFCFVGDYDRQEPDELMLHVAAQRVLVPWLHQHSLPVLAITGHRDWQGEKTCPGSQFSMDRLRAVCFLYL